MTDGSLSEVSERIFNFFTECGKKKEKTALFAGAGVGKRVGLPSWKEFMLNLATFSGRYNSIVETLIRKEVEKENYLYVGSIYKLCRDIPKGEKFKFIAAQFESPVKCNLLSSIMSLPFSAVVTTNYDRSLYDSYSMVYRKSAKTVELNDPTMDHAGFLVDFFIARLHGRVDVPESMMFSDEDYGELNRNCAYIDLLNKIFTQYCCLFIGFSFLDPAIDKILGLIRERILPSSRKYHLAIIPDNNRDKRLKENILSTNIDICEFNNSDGCRELWDAIDTVCSRLSSKVNETGGGNQIEAPVKGAFENIKKYISTAYARVKVQDEIKPLVEVVADGIILNLLIESGMIISKKAISGKIQKLLSLSIEESVHLTNDRLSGLCVRGWCQIIDEDKIRLVKSNVSDLDKDLSILSKSVQDRYFLRSGESIERDLRAIIEEVLVVRGWDLGAHYSGAADGLPDLLSTLKPIIERECPDLSRVKKDSLVLSLNDIFSRPEENEGKILGELGRIAFCLQLIFNSPSSTLTHKIVLPENLYLDASILMPAIVEGHPLQSVYNDTIIRLTEAARKADKKVNIYVADGFLNEIITHRKKAIEEVIEIGLENADLLAKYLMRFGAENVNVFISAYGGHVERAKNKLSFSQFLNNYARYSTEMELAEYLKKRGFLLVKQVFENPEQKMLYYRFISELENAYREIELRGFEKKSQYLINHEAYQLLLLLNDIKKGTNSFFVTADRKFRNAVKQIDVRDVQHALISHRALVQLVDLLVGLDSGNSELTRIYWGCGSADDSTLILNYFTNLALSHRDEAMVKTLPEVLDRFVPKVMGDIKEQRINLSSRGDAQEKRRTVKYLDRVENNFYKNMAQVVREKYPDSYSTVEYFRKQHLKQSVNQLENEMMELKKKLKTTGDKQEKRLIESRIRELDNSLKELANMDE